MRLIKTLLVLLFLTPLLAKSIVWEEYARCVFVEQTIVRDSPSKEGRQLGVLSLSENLDQYKAGWNQSNLDTIDGISGFWIPILYQEKEAYVWNGDVSTVAFKSELDIENLIQIKKSSNQEISFKVIRGGKLIHEKTLPSKDTIKYFSAKSVGTAYYSNGNELILLSYNDRSRELFEWTGTEMKTSEHVYKADDKVLDQEDSTLVDFVVKHKVNLRAAPSMDSSIIANLPIYSEVKIVNAYEKRDKVWGEEGYWNKVMWKGKEGYVWKDAVSRSMKKISSTKYEGISYMYGLKSLIVFKNDQPIDCVTRSYLPYAQRLYTKGNLGLKRNYEFIGAYYSGGSCGKPSGEALFLWDGQKIRFVLDEYAVGDGGEGEETIYIFPINLAGVKDKVIHEYYVESSFDLPHCVTKESGYLRSYSEKSIRYLKFELDSFVEVSSRHSKLNQAIDTYKKGYKLVERSFSDLNNDGIEDVVFRANKFYKNGSLGSIIGYAFGIKGGGFKIIGSTSELTKKAFLLDIQTKGNSFSLTFAGYADTKVIQTLHFQISSDGKAFWKSKETITVTEDPNNRRNEICTPKLEKFKSQQIEFMKAWVHFDDEY